MMFTANFYYELMPPGIDKGKALDEITDDNNHDGIAHSLYRYIPELKNWMSE